MIDFETMLYTSFLKTVLYNIYMSTLRKIDSKIEYLSPISIKRPCRLYRL